VCFLLSLSSFLYFLSVCLHSFLPACRDIKRKSHHLHVKHVGKLPFLGPRLIPVQKVENKLGKSGGGGGVGTQRNARHYTLGKHSDAQHYWGIYTEEHRPLPFQPGQRS
jgi:hypothetical protein